MQAISDPGSPQYHRFLTPAQFARQFGPTTSTIEQVTATLQQQGLTVGRPSPTGLSLPVSATVAQVQSAFATPISKYHLSSGKTGYDNASAPEVPASVAPQIEGILGLDTLSPPQPSTSVPQASPAMPDPEAELAVPERWPRDSPRRDGKLRQQHQHRCESTFGALDAPELAQAYSFDSLYSSNDYGAGSTVALVEPAGTGATRRATSAPSPHCYGITLGERADLAEEAGRHGERHRGRHGRGGARHRDRALPGAQGGHRGVRGRRVEQPLRRVQPDRQ